MVSPWARNFTLITGLFQEQIQEYLYSGNSKYRTPLGPDQKFGFVSCEVFLGTLRRET